LVYHLTYHHSLGIHVNHLVFLNAYLLAVLTLLDGTDALLGFPALLPAGTRVLPAALVAALCMYALRLGGVRSVPYCAFVAALGWIATARMPGLLQELGGYHENDNGDDGPSQQAARASAGAGFGLMLAAFMCQLAGHALFEVFQAPPSLMHGFFAAPVLEWLALLGRLGLMPQSVMQDVSRRVKAIRTTSSASSSSSVRRA
jgi:hypothetical protein